MFQDADATRRRAEARIGQSLKGKWTLDALLGVGGMAAVYSAVHRNGGRLAVKWLHPEIALDKHMRERFSREGYIANRIHHRGVVRVIDDETADDGGLILLMDLLEGETVDARWEKLGRRMPILEALQIAEDLLDVLSVAHGAGVVHRDLKPENLFLTRDGQLKVLDFGIARLRELAPASGATNSQSSMGTPAFMPPEQARGRWQEVDARTDIWAVGATLFTLIAGRYVHVAETVNEQLLLSMTHPAPSLAMVASPIPPEVAYLIDKALAFNAEERWQSAAEMRGACTEIMQKLTAAGDVPAISVREESKIALPPGPLTTERAATSVVSIEAIATKKSRGRRAIFGSAMLTLAAFALGGTVMRLGPQATPVSVAARAPIGVPASVQPVVSAPAPIAAPPAASERPAVAPAASSAPRAAAPVVKSQVRKVAPAPSPAPVPAAPAEDWHDRRN
jgi:serine/threonine-protein kinase